MSMNSLTLVFFKEYWVLMESSIPLKLMLGGGGGGGGRENFCTFL